MSTWGKPREHQALGLERQSLDLEIERLPSCRMNYQVPWFRYYGMWLPGPTAAAPRPKLYASWVKLSLHLRRQTRECPGFRSLLIHGSSDPPGQGLEIWDEAAKELLQIKSCSTKSVALLKLELLEEFVAVPRPGTLRQRETAVCLVAAGS